MRLSDLEPRFTCQACGRRGADVRQDWQSVEAYARNAVPYERGSFGGCSSPFSQPIVLSVVSGSGPSQFETCACPRLPVGEPKSIAPAIGAPWSYCLSHDLDFAAVWERSASIPKELRQGECFSRPICSNGGTPCSFWGHYPRTRLFLTDENE